MLLINNPNKLLMRKLNEVVQYDFQRNTFYKINKQTGIQSPSYKTGENMKKFKPDVTGYSYLIRRRSEREEPQTEPRLPKERSFNNERILPEYSYFKTIQTSRRDSKATETSILMRSTISNRKQPQQKSKERQNSFLKMREEGEEGAVSRQKSQQRQSKALLNQTLSNYTKLLKEKVRENNSPKRDQYQGSQTARDPLDTLYKITQMVKPNATTLKKTVTRDSSPIRQKISILKIKIPFSRFPPTIPNNRPSFPSLGANPAEAKPQNTIGIIHSAGQQTNEEGLPIDGLIIIFIMDAEIKQIMMAVGKSRAVQDIEKTLPIEQTPFSAICESEQWRAMMERYFKQAEQRSDNPSSKAKVQLLIERVNFQLQRKGDKKLKL